MTQPKDWDDLTPQGAMQRMNAQIRADETADAFLSMVKESTEKSLAKNERFSVVADIVADVLLYRACYKGRGRKYDNFFKAAASGNYEKATKLIRLAMFFGYCEGVRKAKRDKEQTVFKAAKERKPKVSAEKAPADQHNDGSSLFSGAVE